LGGPEFRYLSYRSRNPAGILLDGMSQWMVGGETSDRNSNQACLHAGKRAICDKAATWRMLVTPPLRSVPGRKQKRSMIRTPALKVLIASSHADTRVAVSWMLRQTFPDAIVSKTESVSDALQTAAAETPACVVGDASLADFATEVSGFAQTLWQRGLSDPVST
jgi:hypothetical protein